MDLFNITIREIQRRPGRAILTMLSIVIGVAAIISVSLAVSDSREAYKRMYEIMAGRASLEVAPEAGGSIDNGQAVTEEVAQNLDVRAAAPMIQNITIMRKQGKRYQLLAVGIDPEPYAKVHDIEVVEGRMFQNSDEVLLESNFAKAADIQVNDQVLLLSKRVYTKFTVVGLLATKGLGEFSQAGIVYMPLPSAQYYFRRPGQIDTISIVLDDKADPAEISKKIAERLPAGLAVRQPAERARLGRDVFLNAEHGLRFAGALTMTLAVFIILNTFLMNVGERKRQLAILRTVGATRGQIQRMLLGESLMMGVIGTLIGIPIGLLGAKFLLSAMAMLRAQPAPPLHWTLGPLLLAAGIGPGMALLGALIPARLAGAVSPLEGIRAANLFDVRRASRRMTLFGIIIFILAGLIVAACIAGWLPITVSIPAGVIFLASFALVIPRLLHPVGRGLAFFLNPWLGVEAELAEIQLTRHSTRCGLTAGVLYIAVGTGVGLGTTILTNVQDVHNWYRKTMLGDFFVRATFQSQATGEALPMPDSFADDIRKMPAVTAVEPVRFLSVKVGDLPVILVSRELNIQQELPLDLVQGKPDQVRRDLLDGQVVVGSVLAQRAGIKKGDYIEVKTPPDTSTRLKVAGTSTDYSVGGMVIYMERSAAQRILKIEGADVLMVHAEVSQLQQVYQQLHIYCDKQGLLLHSFADLTNIVNNIMNGVVNGLWGLLALGFVVAGFGIANTLTMNVLEQTREIGLLRAIAMTRHQVRKMVLAEAAMIAIIGLVTGTLGGIINSYVIGLCMLPLVGYSVPFVIHPLFLLGIFPAVLIIVLASAWTPMQRAAGLDLLVALSYE